MRQPALLITLICSLTLIGCSNNPEPDVLIIPVMESVTGSITYRQRIALTPEAIVNVQLLDISKADAPAIIIAEQTLSTPGQVPIAFELMYNPDIIKSGMTYSVSAKIFERGELRFISDTVNPVLTNDNGNTAELVLVAVGNQAAADAAPTKWLLSELNGDIIDLPEEQTPFIKVDSAAGRIMGFSGCNRFNGSYEKIDGKVELGPLATTMMACIDNADIETRFMQTLGSVSDFIVEGEQLTGINGDEVLLLFTITE